MSLLGLITSDSKAATSLESPPSMSDDSLNCILGGPYTTGRELVLAIASVSVHITLGGFENCMLSSSFLNLLERFVYSLKFHWEANQLHNTQPTPPRGKLPTSVSVFPPRFPFMVLCAQIQHFFSFKNTNAV